MSAEPLSPEEIEAIRERDAKRTPGKWMWWTSNSYRRLSAGDRDGNVAYGCVQPSDGHPDIAISEKDMAFIENASEDIPRLLATLDARGDVVALAEAWGFALSEHRWKDATIALDKLYSLLGHGSMMTRAEFESGELAKLRHENARLREELAELRRAIKPRKRI